MYGHVHEPRSKVNFSGHSENVCLLQISQNINGFRQKHPQGF